MKRVIVNERGETVVRMSAADIARPLTQEQRQQIREAKAGIYDEECPPMSEALILKMKQDIAVQQGSGEVGQRQQAAVS